MGKVVAPTVKHAMWSALMNSVFEAISEKEYRGILQRRWRVDSVMSDHYGSAEWAGAASEDRVDLPLRATECTVYPCQPWKLEEVE